MGYKTKSFLLLDHEQSLLNLLQYDWGLLFDAFSGVSIYSFATACGPCCYWLVIGMDTSPPILECN